VVTLGAPPPTNRHTGVREWACVPGQASWCGSRALHRGDVVSRHRPQARHSLPHDPLL